MKVEVDVRDTMKSLAMIVTIRGAKRMRVRVKAGSALIKIGARVIGMDVQVKTVATGGFVKPSKSYLVGDVGSPFFEDVPGG